jgi:hypothetical protein
MPELGGLREIADVKGLILFLLQEADCILKEGQLTDVLMEDGLVEYFDYAEAKDQLLMTGLMDIASLEEMSSYRITKSGREIVQEYEKKIPYNVRSKTLAALKRNLRQKKEEDEIHAEIRQTQSGYLLDCQVSEGGETMLGYQVLLPDHKTAFYAAERFKENPTQYYQKILEIVLNQNPFHKPE